MLPGPVFNVELLTTARRARYYAVRALYGLILLFVLYQTYSSYFWLRGQSDRSYSINYMANFANATFAAVAMSQLFAVLLLTPTLVAGVIADEKQRKTLHYLLASRLTSGEIVLGKLAARLLHIGVFLAIGLPVVSLIGLFGGVDPLFVGLVYLGTFSTAFLLAGVSIWISTTARRVRDAIIAVYLIEFAWLVLPPVARGLQWTWPALFGWIARLIWVFEQSSPFSLLYQSVGLFRMGGPAGIIAQTILMVAIQTGVGIACVGLAVLRLRPIFRNQAGESPRKRLASWGVRRRQRRRPACGDDPMLWKEQHFVRSGGLVRLLVRTLTFIGLLALGYFLVYFGRPAFAELLVFGYGSGGPTSARDDLNGYIRFCVGAIYVVWMLAAAVAAASSVTSEKEEDTWTSLTATTLTGPEILLAKMIGALWASRFLGFVLLGILLAGVALSAVHPIGLLVTVFEIAIFAWFVASLGVYISLKSKNTTRASALTVGILLTTNAGYLMCCIPMSMDTVLALAPCTPGIVGTSPISYDDLWAVLGWEHNWLHRDRANLLATGILSVLCYGIAALFLTVRAVKSFDSVVDRPVRVYWDADRPMIIATAE